MLQTPSEFLNRPKKGGMRPGLQFRQHAREKRVASIGSGTRLLQQTRVQRVQLLLCPERRLLSPLPRFLPTLLLNLMNLGLNALPLALTGCHGCPPQGERLEATGASSE